MKVEATDVVIRCTPEEAFDCYANGERYPEWMTGTKHMRMLTPEPIGAGSRFTGSFRGIGTVPWEILEYDRPRRMVHLGHAPIGDMRHTIMFEQVDGGTRVRQRGDGELKGIFRLVSPIMEPLVRRMMAKNWHQTALGLKGHLEGTAHKAV